MAKNKGICSECLSRKAKPGSSIYEPGVESASEFIETYDPGQSKPIEEPEYSEQGISEFDDHSSALPENERSSEIIVDTPQSTPTVEATQHEIERSMKTNSTNIFDKEVC